MYLCMHAYIHTHIQAKHSYMLKERISKGGLWVSQQEKATATKPEDLGLILETHTVREN